ncbi:hypothetical protein B5X24_HaOG202935 [Helicoverpa armigera]|uniref:N-acetylneuraminate lyase n=1 Tax=Helicoverpa armigera TaxID=29058 RepID=A0A2W1BW33_HELAM|nr:hypothetical protein B5X24_HaOG202935 [Helicoverpa armigera]
MPPVFTPLNDDLTINYGIIPAYAKFLADSGIKSVLVGGTTGEHMSLSVADRKKVIDAWVAVAKTTGLHIQVQVGGAPLADVTELVRFLGKKKIIDTKDLIISGVFSHLLLQKHNSTTEDVEL